MEENKRSALPLLFVVEVSPTLVLYYTFCLIAGKSPRMNFRSLSFLVGASLFMALTNADITSFYPCYSYDDEGVIVSPFVVTRTIYFFRLPTVGQWRQLSSTVSKEVPSYGVYLRQVSGGNRVSPRGLCLLQSSWGRVGNQGVPQNLDFGVSGGGDRVGRDRCLFSVQDGFNL